MNIFNENNNYDFVNLNSFYLYLFMVVFKNISIVSSEQLKKHIIKLIFIIIIKRRKIYY